MQASFPIPGEVFESHYRRYRLWVDDPDAALIVTVTTFSGDPDLYISRDAQPLVG